jgi:hypothetical protein
MSNTQTTQITTGEGENNYNAFRRYFHENIEGDYGSQMWTIYVSIIIWTFCIIYLYYLLIGTQTSSDYLQQQDRTFLYAFTIIAIYPYLQFFSRFLRLRAGELEQSRYTGQSNMTPHCTQSLLELSKDMQKDGIIGTIDFECKEKVTTSMMKSFNDLGMKSYMLSTALLMIIIYLITQGKAAEILSENNLFLRAAVRFSLIAGVTVMVMSGFSVGTHNSQIIKSVPEAAYIIQGACVFIIIAFILNRSISLR